MSGGIVRSVTGTLRYTSNQEERRGAERGREFFRIDVHADGSRTIAAHGEIDDAPAVVRDVNLRVDADRAPQECFVRIAVGGAFRGSAWFRFAPDTAECEAFTAVEGRVRQTMTLDRPLPAFGNHAMANDGFMLSLYDLSQGPGVQVIERLLLSSPDHRGATGPMLFAVDLALEFVGEETVTVAAGTFDALHFRMVDVPGLPLEHPEYDLWCTADGDYVLLKAAVGGYMQTAYELTHYEQQGR
ncbi:hypothetical protein GRI72_11515 [Altererythrobacter marinus]|uniref:DUF3108 domain-containing protein n=1 Tax=Pelagerythrobacter marinus TaxID=538382 RepID=A0ABW9V068_9SPHN|nr:DUF3108 domain-containing protein [Pelagerythrobacter marinus]MXO69448.1 hypothetical protein [Pelagerythrobacter marinus]